MSVAGLVASCAMAGYAVAHVRLRGRTALLFYVLPGMMIPLQAILIPAFKTMSLLGLVNTYAAVILT